MPSIPFRWFPSSSSRPSSPLPGYTFVPYNDDDESSADDPNERERSSYEDVALGFSMARRSSSQGQLLLPRVGSFIGTSAPNSPYPSRPTSPAPTPLQSIPLYTSTSEDEPTSPLVLGAVRRRKWWPRRRKREPSRKWKRILHRIVKHPLFPTQPLTILLALLLLTTLALLITLSLIYILNPDKWALPWRQYCSHASASTFPPADFESLPPAGIFLGVFSMDAAVERRMLVRTSWASHVRSRGMDGATDRTVVRFILGRPRPEWERRVALEMQVYNDIIILPVSENMNNGKTHAYFTWAHQNALVPPPNTNHTFNPVHRLPAPPAPLSPRPTAEGSSSAAADTQIESSTDASSASATSSTSPAKATETDDNNNDSAPEPQLPAEGTPATPQRKGPAPPILAPHDPRPQHRSRSMEMSSHARLTKRKSHGGKRTLEPEQWVAPDFVIKADDDSFVMLAELEGRLRVEWADALSDSMLKHGKVTDPLIFWGYLVKSRFMAGELYALSSALVSYIATTPRLLTMTRGAEDKQTSKWIKLHPQANQVRWRSEHCWIYDHPRAGTVYSHGFLFPSEAERVAKQVDRAKEIIKNTTSTKISSSSLSSEVASLLSDPGLVALSTSTSSATSTGKDDTSTIQVPGNTGPWTWDPDRWQPGPPSPAATPLPPSSPFLSRSTVSDFGSRYTFPLSNLTIPMQVEALIEGSPVSRLRTRFPLHDNATSTAALIGEEPKWDEVEKAWDQRETYEERYAPSSLRSRGVHDPSAPIKPPSVEEEEEEDPQNPDTPASTRIFGPRGIGLGGTVVVHFIKRNEWFLEAAMALLGPSWNGDEGRVNPGEPKSAEGAKTVISKTQSFKAKRQEAIVEEDGVSEDHAIPLEDDGVVQPGADQAP